MRRMPVLMLPPVITTEDMVAELRRIASRIEKYAQGNQKILRQLSLLRQTAGALKLVAETRGQP
jgi:hypothetical protein